MIYELRLYTDDNTYESVSSGEEYTNILRKNPETNRAEYSLVFVLEESDLDQYEHLLDVDYTKIVIVQKDDNDEISDEVVFEGYSLMRIQQSVRRSGVSCFIEFEK